MKKNLYYRSMFQRKNRVKEFFLNLFLLLASYPRMVIEVFIRKNFGERYFSFTTSITISVILAIIPFGARGLSMLIRRGRIMIDWPSFLADYAIWYLFIAAFVHFCLQRRREVKRNPSVFDFERFSLYSGDINPSFYGLRLFGKPSVRTIEILYEPALAFGAGMLLIFLGQAIGLVLLVCSLMYSLSYAGAYYEGDNFVLDKIDEMICNEELFDAFVDDKDASETRGVRFYGRKPASDDIRRRVVESFTEDTEESFVAQ